MFDSYYSESLIFKYFTASTRSSNLSSFSLVKISFELLVCVLDACMNVSSVTLLSSAIDLSSMNLRIAF